MTRTRREQINHLAETLLEALELEAPVDVLQAVSSLRGTVNWEDTEIDGKIERVGSGFRITLPRDGFEPRERFSIAHELGHLFLHMGYLTDEEKWNRAGEYNDSVYYRQGYGEEESEANEFAGAFLMPRAEFRRIAQQHKTENAYNVSAIAKHFNVSDPAALIRGRFLGMFAWD